MRRSLTKLGNNSYVVTLPKAWIRKHNLEPKTSLEITEAGSKLIISTDIIRSELSPHVVCCEDGNEVSINSKIIALYRAGYSEAKLIDTKASPEILGKVCKYASNFPGVTIEQKENAIIMKSTEGLGRRSEIIGKCYLNLLMFSDLLAAEVKAVDWEKQLNDMYQSINFNCESVFRLI
jgi:antitoxin component of MazEF toxin-antitoxin module